MSDKNIIGIRLKCLELAVITQTQSTLPMFPSTEIHVLANKFQHYVETGEWEYDINTNENGEEQKNTRT